MRLREVDDEGNPIPWQTYGKCKGMDPDLFFSDNTGGAQMAKRVCNGQYDGDVRCPACGSFLQRQKGNMLTCSNEECDVYEHFIVGDEPCPVRQQCLDYAVDNHEWDGVWGGRVERERRVYARSKKRKLKK